MPKVQVAADDTRSPGQARCCTGWHGGIVDYSQFADSFVLSKDTNRNFVRQVDLCRGNAYSLTDNSSVSVVLHLPVPRRTYSVY